MTHEQFLDEIAREAGFVMQTHWTPAGVDFELKPDKTRVTLADQEIGDYLAAMFARHYPRGVCIREEANFPTRRGKGIEGVFDEVDGTEAFSIGRRQAVFAGVIMDDHMVQAAIIHAPLLETPLTFTASLGTGAFCNKERISVSKRKSGKLWVAVGTATGEPDENERYVAAALIADLEGHGFNVEPMHSSSYSCAKLASGNLHGAIFAWDAIHDIVMGHALVMEAGGVTSDLNGDRLDFRQNTLPGYVMAGCPEIHEQLLKIVARHRRTPQKERA